MKLQSFLTRRNILIILICLALIFSFAFWYFHGFIIATSSDGVAKIRYISTSNLNREVKSGSNKTFLASGKYVIEVSDTSSGEKILKYATVPHFFNSTHVSSLSPSRQHEITVIGRGTLPNLALTESKLIAYNISGQTQTVNISNITNSQPLSTNNSFPSLSQSIVLNSQLIGGIENQSNKAIIPVIYNVTNSEVNTFPSVDTKNQSDISLKSSPDGFTSYIPDTKRVYLYSIHDSRSVSSSISLKNITPSTYNDRPIYSYANNTLAIATGASIFDTDEGNSTNKYKSNRIILFDTKTEKQITTLNTNVASLKDVYLSPNGKYIALEASSYMEIYSLASRKIIFTVPYQVNQLIWADDDKYVFSVSGGDIYTGSISKRTAETLVSYSIIKPTKLLFISNGNLYFTAYPVVSEGNANPDAFRVSLEQTADSSSRNIISKLPHQGDGYYIDSIDNVIYIQLTKYIDSTSPLVTHVDESAKQAALTYVNNLIGDSKKYVIKYKYVTMNLDY